MVLQCWRLRQADGKVLAEKEGCVGIVEVRRWRMWNTVVVKMYWHGRGEGEIDTDNEGEGGVAEYGG